jgi:hypothetical protein
MRELALYSVMAEGKWLMAESAACPLPSAICHDMY